MAKDQDKTEESKDSEAVVEQAPTFKVIIPGTKRAKDDLYYHLFGKLEEVEVTDDITEEQLVVGFATFKQALPFEAGDEVVLKPKFAAGITWKA